jgi:DNA polymerase IIIc chi subunit
MQRPSAPEFLINLLEALEDLPPEFARRLAEALKEKDEDRAQAIRRVFEDVAGD